MRRTASILFSMILVCVLLSACTKAADTTAETAGQSAAQAAETQAAAPAEDFSETGTLNLSWPSDNGTDLLPFPWSNRNAAVAMLFDPLVALNADGVTIEPMLASEWSVSEDGLTYQFTLRDDVTWHDGQKLTAEDVEFSLRGYIVNPTSEYSDVIGLIEGSDAVIDGTAAELSGYSAEGNKITLKLSSARNDFLTYCAIVSILPKHILGNEDLTLLSQNEAFLKNPVGCGAYKVDTVNIPNYFTLVRNDAYYGEKAGIKNVTFTSYSEGGATATTAAIIAENLDLIHNVGDMSRAKNIQTNNSNIVYNVIPANYARYFVFNTAGATDGKYNDDVLKKEVRQAFNLLLDKEAIAGFYGDIATPLTTFVNPGSSSYNANIPLFTRDVEKAKQMLKDADFDFSRTVRIAYYYSDQTTADIMALIVQNFADAGVKAEATIVTGSIVDVVYKQHNWDLCYFGNYGLEPVGSFYYNLVTPTGLFVHILGDFEAETRAEFKTLKDKYYTVNTEKDKQAVLDELQIKHLEHMYTIPLYAVNKIEMHNAAKFAYPEGLFGLDVLDWLDYEFSEWQLLKK